LNSIFRKERGAVEEAVLGSSEMPKNNFSFELACTALLTVDASVLFSTQLFELATPGHGSSNGA
jgi:hypothetical protein